jgi:hypothetical protein
MRLKKQSMRQLRDAAAVERSVAIVEAIGDIALRMRVDAAPPSDTPRYYRGALIKPKRSE